MPKSNNTVIPRELFALLIKATREGARDSRRDDRVLHDTTRDALTTADDALTAFLDKRAGVGA